MTASMNLSTVSDPNLSYTDEAELERLRLSYADRGGLGDMLLEDPDLMNMAADLSPDRLIRGIDES